MVNFCAMIGCGNRGKRDKKSFFHLPAVIEKEGDKTRTLSEKRRNCENSNLLSHLTPGDTILADRGFDIKESVGLYCATVAIPNFTKGKKQLTGIEVEQSRRIANVRIHVERVIGVVRQKFTILSATHPIEAVTAKDGVTLLDQIVCVCCSLINLCDSVVPFE